MISTIFLDDSLIEPIVETTCETTTPPLRATSAAERANWLACIALSPFCFTVLVNSSIEAEVSSSELACCSVRFDRSRLPDAIWSEAPSIVYVAARTSRTMRAKLEFMPYSAWMSCPNSFVERTSICAVKSPSATRCAMLIACCNGSVILRTKTIPVATPSSTARISTVSIR